MGALPGPNSSSVSGVNTAGASAGISTTGSIDPLTGWPTAVAVLWKRNGQIVNLGTLGGNESVATAINDQGQVVGMAANAIPDSISFAPLALPGYGTQQRAFLWQRGAMSDLGTLGGPDAAAFMINEHSQVVGMSYSDSIPSPVTGLPTLAPFMWDRGTIVNLGTLGGAFGLPLALNRRGQVTGFSDVAGDLSSHPFLWNGGVITDLGTFGGDNGEADSINDAGDIVGSADFPGDQIHHAFLWRNGRMNDLGTVAGDPCSRVSVINQRGQIVGGSSDCQTFLHAYLWENGGPMIDLNTFVPPGSDLTLTEAGTINDRGEIEATGVLPNGDFHAVMLIPCDAASADTRCHRGEVKLPAAKPSTARADALGMVPAFLRARQRNH
jgi:probable HAF family extracellular repeat protein